jgi:drug/metabolite transporter (DMT)-like permease
MAAMAVGMALFFLGLDEPSATAPDPLVGNVLGAAAGLSWALTVMGLRALGKSGGGGAAAGAAVLGNALTFLACLPLALPVAGATGADWAGLAFLGVVPVGLAYVFLTRAMARVPAFEASLLLLLEPVLNPLWAWLVHGERPGAWSLAGGALILAATAAKTWLDARQQAPASDAHSRR